MTEPHTNRHLRSLAAITAVLLFSASCTQDHLARQEGVTPDVGNANRANMVQMAKDTTPASARRIDHVTDGTRMANAIDDYHNPNPPAPSGEASGEASTADSGTKQQ